uniref:Uncharacterized protein n=1 Tax=Eucampia antarctica TaxID=49252 RepID=A0A7S2VYU2_9STRA|mmetsp:Transcript_11464/g.10976  ORF Transcript_11464/g.10976 Transcript_11464/m.10976 type:complete len:175 (+) Transcript_11464:90-614(+)|eukprot:CAMPEP_0197834732 /NCGR_PEP_ID=MMETSP1437-20131217/23473_1 /TAXON_ID=49252 ORGANISM="Eucampia antarctica, Strain CCMP1452" /NCGR_SAMPLE_ID=MMETSP1437 /ASSEMBLY_ACC=CAM_ASM_001096 /LENGTH=174 /DNA_ID=CAMNT_0043439653 /DNA_START=67 /DNA_END=591 /DNA_ORIENTATION=+
MAFRASSFRSLAAKMTAAERDLAVREANEKMRLYHVNRPSLEKLNRRSKSRSSDRDNQHLIQFGLVSSFLVAFLSTPFIGKRIAQDEKFREKYIPKWYDYTLEKPDYAWTRAELHEQLVQLQRELHERAIAGDFSPDKLDGMRRHFAGVDPKNDPHGWGKLHPGVEDDEDIEDD